MVSHPQRVAGAVSSAGPIEAQVSDNGGAAELDWDDNWDSDFAQTALSFQRFHGAQLSPDSSVTRLQGEFQDLAREFESGSL